MATGGYTEISWEDIKLGKEITSKESSRRNKVFEATWTSSQGGQRVAAKYCMNFKAEEAKILAKLEHKNIIKFYGVANLTFLPDTYVIVTEFAEKGSLYSLIDQHRDTWQEFKKPYWMKWAREGTEALQFIHEQNYQHGDVKSPNFVITSDDTMKICDFGTAREHFHTVSTTSIRGSWPWMASEVMGKLTDTKFKITVKADVFSYAVVLWELITGEIPFKGQTQLEIFKTVSEERKRLEIPSDCPEHLRQLLLACWDHDYGRRPNMNEVLTCLKLNATPSVNKEVKRGCCWRCGKHLQQYSVRCNRCHLAEYCNGQCRQEDNVRHGSVECEVFGPKCCNHCGKFSQVKECVGCNNAWYCNKVCQGENRTTHRTQCKRVSSYIKETSKNLNNFHVFKGENIYKAGEPPVYIGNTIAADFLALEENEWSKLDEVGEEELHKDYHVLSAGCGDLRNTVMTIASLPARYQGNLHITLDDLDPFVMARNVMFLVMMVQYANREGIESSLATIWYSLHISQSDYELILTTLQDLVKASHVYLRILTHGLVTVSENDLSYLREVWEKWLSLQCQRNATDSIDLHQQRRDVFDKDFGLLVGLPQYLDRLQLTDASRKSMEGWFDHGVFLPMDIHHNKHLPFDNPTLTGRPNMLKASTEEQLQLGRKRPKECPFVYCIRPDQTPFLVWDCLKVDEFGNGGPQDSSVIERYHAYVTHLLQQVVTFIRLDRLTIHIFLANCLDFPNHHLTLKMPSYDRIFTSNLADFLGLCKLLKTFKPLLNSNNKYSTIVTQFMNWIRHTPQADVDLQPKEEVLRYATMCQKDTGFSERLSQDTNNHREYFNNTHWFLAYLRAEVMGGGFGIPTMDRIPKLSEVMHYNGLRMRDFRKRLNKLVPFQYRVNSRKITMENGKPRYVEWCLPNHDD